MQTISDSDGPKIDHADRGSSNLSQLSFGSPALDAALVRLTALCETRLTNDFIGRCDPPLLARSAKELGITVSNGDWAPYEDALTARLDAVRVALSKQIFSRLSHEYSGLSRADICSTIVGGAFQIHTDTDCSFWIGAPSTEDSFLNVLRGAIDLAQPFEADDLRQLVMDIFLSHCYAGTLPLAGFSYAAVKSSFVTLAYNQLKNPSA
jgi:hypothetical protein